MRNHWLDPAHRTLLLPPQPRRNNRNPHRPQSPATTLLTHAQKYGRLIAQLPFIKMVAITGSVAAHNPTDDADLDYMIITETNRLWLCRLMILVVDKLAQRDGYTLCPNFMLTDRNLKLPVRNLYVARELMQMLPLSGYPIYEQFLDQNRWVSDFLPNATPMPPSPPLQSNGFKKISQFILGGSLGNRLEKWEQTRKIAKLSHLQADTETRFTPDMCKGHYHGHLTRVMEAYGD